MREQRLVDEAPFIVKTWSGCAAAAPRRAPSQLGGDDDRTREAIKGGPPPLVGTTLALVGATRSGARCAGGVTPLAQARSP